MKIKKILLSMMLIFAMAFSFTGCASVEFIRKLDETDVIFDRLAIELDEKKINSYGKNVDDVMLMVQMDLMKVGNYINNWKDSFYSNPELDIIAKKIELGINVKVEKPDNSNNRIYLTVEFANLQMFGLFYGYTTIENHEYNKAMQDVGPFINQILSKKFSNESFGLFLYKNSIIKDSGFLKNLKTFEFEGVNYYNKYIEAFDSDCDINDVKFYEMFTYPDDRLYSNADNQSVTGGLSMYRWYLNDKSDDFNMILYKLSPRTVSWYVLALVISLIFVITVSIILIIKYKKKKVKNIKIGENIDV